MNPPRRLAERLRRPDLQMRIFAAMSQMLETAACRAAIFPKITQAWERRRDVRCDGGPPAMTGSAVCHADDARRRASILCRTLVLLLICLASARVTAELALDPLGKNFDIEFKRVLASEKIPGGAYAIVYRDQVLKLGAFGKAAQNDGRPIDSFTAFRIASLSKGFSGVLAALLASEQTFSLSEPITDYVPGFQLKPTLRPMTIEDVLGQRSGYVRNAFDNLIEAGIARNEILPRFSELEPLCAPGKCYSYQNNVFSMIEDVVAQTTGQSFAQAMHARLFEPLGMAGATMGFDAFAGLDNRAEPHLKTKLGWHRSPLRKTYYQVQSAAGINATSYDMAQWAIAILGHRPEVIPPEIIDEVSAPRITTRNELSNRNWRGRISQAHYGLGWRVYQLDDHSLILHSGWVAGYRAEIAVSRHFDLGLVLMINAESHVVGSLNRFFWDQVLSSAAPD
ncbi:MAG: serine hydrolase domain-containing protein [Wenzhouxiangellaceae bacterium]